MLHRKPPCSYFSLDDLIHTGVLGLIDACDKGDVGRETFRAFAKVRIRGAILDSVKGEAFQYSRAKLELVDAPAPSRAERYDLLDLLHHLPPNCAELMRLRIEGYTRKEAAAQLGISPERARTFETTGIERLRELCQPREMRRAA